MADAVSGYITADGRFFESQAKAEYEEAKYETYLLAEKSIHINTGFSQDAVAFIEANAEYIKVFCQAVINLGTSSDKEKNAAKLELEELNKGENLDTSEEPSKTSDKD